MSYYTIFGIVPLAIVAVLIFNSIPAYHDTGEQLKRLVYQELRLTSIEYPDPDNPEKRVVLTDYLDEIINRFFESINKGSLGLVSAILVIWAALRLLSLIEIAFNHMWYVPKGRRFIHRVINYWALLTLGPLLLARRPLRDDPVHHPQEHRGGTSGRGRPDRSPICCPCWPCSCCTS